MNSYQKLKKRVADLERDLRTVILKPDSREASGIASRVMFKDDLDKTILFGSRNSTKSGRGLFDTITDA